MSDNKQNHSGTSVPRGTINESESRLLVEAQKNQSILNSIKETLLPLISSSDTQTLIESIKKESKVLVEQKEKQISVLNENLRIQTEELQLLSEQVEQITEEYEVKLHGERDRRVIIENKLLAADATVHAFTLIKENFRLRNYTPQLLECKTKSEVDRVVETILSLHKQGDNKVEKVTGRSISTPELLTEYLRKEGVKVEDDNYDDDLTEELRDQRRLAGMSV